MGDVRAVVTLISCCLFSSTARAAPELRIFDVEHLTSHAFEPFGQRHLEEILLGGAGVIERDEVALGLSYDALRTGLPTYAPPPGTAMPAGDIEEVLVRLTPDSWWAGENTLSRSGAKLTIVQTPEALAHIESLLGALSARRLRRLELSVAVVPKTALAQIPGQLPGAPWLPAEALDKAVIAAGDAGWCWRGHVAEGETASIRPKTLRVAMRDFDVNTGLDIPIVNPVQENVPKGFTLWACLAATPEPNLVQCDYMTGFLDGSTPGVVRTTPHGDLELYELVGTLFTGRTFLPLEKTALVAEVSFRGKSSAALIRVRRIAGPVSPRVPLRMVEVGSLISDETTWGLAGGEGRTTTARFSEDALKRLLIDALPEDLQEDSRLKLQFHGSGLFVAVPGDMQATERAAQAVEKTVLDLFRKDLCLAEGSILCGVAERAAFEGIVARTSGGVFLPPDWQGRLRLAEAAEFRAAGRADRSTIVWTGATRAYVHSIEEVSGMDAGKDIEVTDPIIRRAGTEFSAAVKLGPVPELHSLNMTITGALTETTFAKTLEVKPDRVMAGPPQAAAPWIIDLPEQKARILDRSITLQTGRAAVLGEHSVPGDPSKVELLIVEGRLVEDPVK